MSRKSRLLAVIPWAIICAVAAWVVVYASVWGIGLSPDSAVYIAQARQWLHPLGRAPVLSSGDGIVPTSVVPAYVLVLTMASVIWQTDPLHAARWLNVVLLPLNLVLAGLLVHQVRPSGRWSPWIAAALLLVSRDLLSVHSMAWTEPLFLALALFALYAFDRWMAEGSSSAWLGLTIAAITAACLTRFAGVALAGAAMLGVVLWARGSFVRRGLRAIGLGVSVVIPMLIWSAFTPGFRSVVYHPPPGRWWGVGLDTVATWIAPPPLMATWDGLRLGIAITTLGGVAWLTSIAWRHANTHNEASSSKLAGLIVLFAACHVLVLVITQFIWDARTNLDGRRLLPVQIAVVLLGVMGADRLLSRAGATASRARRPAATILAAVVALFAGLNVYGAQSWLTRMHERGAGYASREWRESPLLRAVSELPPRTWLLSNANDVIVTLTGRVSERIPSRINPSTQQPAPEHAERMARLRERLGSRDGVVAYFRTMSGPRWYLPSEGDLIAAWQLEVLLEVEDGVLYRVKRPAPPFVRGIATWLGHHGGSDFTAFLATSPPPGQIESAP